MWHTYGFSTFHVMDTWHTQGKSMFVVLWPSALMQVCDINLHVMYMNCAAKCHMGAINTPFSLSRWIPGDKSTYMSVVCHVASMCCATWEAKWTARHRRLRIWNCLYWQKKACCKQNKMSCLLIFVHCFKIYCSVVATKGSLFVGTEAFLDQRLSWQPPFLLCSFSFLFRD